jgi:putative tricarboxylic transport membrane protein
VSALICLDRYFALAPARAGSQSFTMTEPAGHHDISELVEARHHRAEIVFGALSFAFALFLAAEIGAQTTWIDNRRFVEQPAFWPIVSILGMTIFGAFELWFSWRRNRRGRGDGVLPEVLQWAKAIEYVVWFMVYVVIVPRLGYLPTTLVFCAALTVRLGYREPRALLGAIATGLATVVVFKSFLGVKIPGGAVYEYLPDTLRNIMILYF